MKNQILFVDDDANLLAACQRALRKEFAIDTVVGGADALELIARAGPYSVVVADMQMPGMNGIQFLEKIEALAPDTVRVMLTGNADQKTARDAVNEGHIFRFLAKPCAPEILIQTLRASLEQHRLIIARHELLERTLNGGVKVLTDLLSILDPVSFGRAQRLSDRVRRFSAVFKVAHPWELELAAMLSPIGLVTIPAAVLERSRSNQRLTATEQDMLSRVPEVGSRLLSQIPQLESVAALVLLQNKNFDGSGFPADHLSGDEIPLGARILRVLSDLLILEEQGAEKFEALEQITHQARKYDPELLTLIAAQSDFRRPASAPPPIRFKAVALRELRAGAILNSELRTSDGTLIVTAGAEVSAALLEKLNNFSQIFGIREPISIRV